MRKPCCLKLTLFSWLTRMSSLSLDILFRDWEEGVFLRWIWLGFSTLGFRSIESIFLRRMRFSFYISMYFETSCLDLELVPLAKWLYCFGVLLSRRLFMFLSLLRCSSCSYRESLNLVYSHLLLVKEDAVGHHLLSLHIYLIIKFIKYL